MHHTPSRPLPPRSLFTQSIVSTALLLLAFVGFLMVSYEGGLPINAARAALALICTLLLGLAVQKLTTARIAFKSLLLLSVSLVFLLAFVGLIFRVMQQNEEAQVWSLHSKEVITRSQALSQTLWEAQSVVRGYAVTDDPEFARSYGRCKEDIPKIATAIQALVADNPPQQEKAYRLQQIASRETTFLDTVVRLVHAGSREQAAGLIASGEGKQGMGAFTRELTAFLHEEERLDAMRRRNLQSASLRVRRTLLLGTALDIGLTLLLTTVFGQALGSRLRSLTRNAHALGAGEEPSAPLTGADEMADLDAVFRSMAADLAAVARREHALIENALDVICSVDAAGRFVNVNPACLRIWGYRPEELIGRLYIDFVTPEDVAKTNEIGEAIMSGHAATAFENRYCHRDGTIVHMSWSAFWSDEDQRMFCVARDISARERADEALRHSEEQFRLLVESAQDYAILMLGPGGHIVSWNAGAERTKGYRAEEIIGQHFSRFYTPEDIARDHPTEELRIARETGHYEEEGWRVRKDGSRFMASVVLTALRDHAGNLRGYSKITRDISERKQAETALRDREQFLSLITDMAPFLIAYVDRDQRYRFVNKAYTRLFGRPEDAIRGNTLEQFLGPDAYSCIQGYVETALRGQEVTYEITLPYQDVGPRHVHCSYSPDFDQNGALQGFVVVVNDITERKEAKAALEQAHRSLQTANDELEIRVQERTSDLERSNRELQDFASVASHDLQEPLRKIQAFGDRLQAKCGTSLNAEGRDYLERMQKAAERMQVLINDLLTFSRVTTKAQPFVPIDLAQVAREVVRDLEVSIERSGGTVEIEDLPIIEADALQMRQLLQNLIGNALKFRRKEEAPRVTVQGRLLTGLPEQEKGQTEGTPAASQAPPLCRLSVRDNGIGFDEKYLDRIFTVFQRLHGRSEYEGTGVGLAVCRKIAERHRGTITATSTPGQGTTFIVTLPAGHLRSAPSCEQGLFEKGKPDEQTGKADYPLVGR